MPFNTATGQYTCATGATNAFPGEVIASATWNSVFTDIQTALTQLGQSQIVFLPRIITTVGGITVATTDRLILINVNVATITLPSAASKVNPVTIIGNASGIFSTHNSVITPNGGDTIDGLATTTLTTDYQSITLYPLAAGNWRVM
jgi:hypothetical protein